MEARHASGVVDLMKENMLLRAEISALVRILESRELTGDSSGNWRALLKSARTTTPYKRLAHRYDDLIQHIAETSTRSEIDQLLESVELYKPVR
jgi:hypothetical protein